MTIEWTQERRRLRDLTPWPRNPRQIRTDQARRLAQSFDEFGQVETLAIGPNGEVYNGHQRLNVLMKKHGPDYEVEVRVASRELTEKEREKLTVFLHKGAAGEWNFDTLANEFDVDELIEWGFDYKELGIDPSGVEKGKQPNPRNLPIDIIFTYDALYDPAVTMAVRAGWKAGTQSTQKENGKPHSCIHQPERWRWLFELAFIDNDYFNYDHKGHVEIVSMYPPKYATTRDIMSEDQCAQAGIPYYPLEQILEWADELSQYAENVIIIPKYDCIDAIPERFVLGYSVPTSHGGTPLSVDMFRGRRVHLLGGSWGAQLEYMAALGDDVVSIDNNYIQKQAQYGSFVYPDGSTGTLSEDLKLIPNNPMYVALAISLGNIGAKVNELYTGSATPAE